MAYRKTPDSAQTVVEQAAALIKERIRDGTLAPGQRLVASDLTATLTISGGALREALRKLVGEGLIIVEPHRGAVVRRLDAGDIREIFELREIVEGLAARLAAERSLEDVAVGAAISDCAWATQNAVGLGLSAYVKENARFHEMLYVASGRERLAALARQLSLPVDRLRNRRLADTKAMASSADEHVAVAAAIRAGRPDEAERLMRDHVRRSGELTMEDL